MPTNSARAAILMRSIEATVSGDSAVVTDIYTDDVSVWTPGVSLSSAVALAVELEDRNEAFSEVELDISPLDVSGDRACAEWVAHLTHSGAFELDDDVVIEPTGLRLSLHGVTVAEFEGDRIRSLRQYWDEAELLMQLGLLPVD